MKPNILVYLCLFRCVYRSFSRELGWLYARYLSAWLCIVTVDYMMEVRLEFAWPFLLLLRSVKDTYTYKGLVSGRWPIQLLSPN